MSERGQLVEALARALCWSGTDHDTQSRYRARAALMADELLRAGNTGNAIHLKKALEDVVRRREGAA